MRHVNVRDARAVEEKTSSARKEDLDPADPETFRRAGTRSRLIFFRNVTQTITGLYERIIRIYTYLRNHYPTVRSSCEL